MKANRKRLAPFRSLQRECERQRGWGADKQTTAEGTSPCGPRGMKGVEKGRGMIQSVFSQARSDFSGEKGLERPKP